MWIAYVLGAVGAACWIGSGIRAVWWPPKEDFAYLLEHCIHEPRCTVWRDCSDLSSRNIANAIHERNEMQRALTEIGYYVELWEDGDNATHSLGHIRGVLARTDNLCDEHCGSPDRGPAR